MTLILHCPGRVTNHGHTYIPGCGDVAAVYRVRDTQDATGRRIRKPIPVCPDCGTRLLPTALEIEHTRGAA